MTITYLRRGKPDEERAQDDAKQNLLLKRYY